MRKNPSFESGVLNPRVLLAFILVSVGAGLALLSFAATPSSGTLSETTPVLTYTAGPFLQSNPVPVPVVQSGPTCGGAQNPCDSYELTISMTAAYIAANPSASAKVTLSWQDTGSGSSDYDLYIYNGVVGNTTATTPVASRGASAANPEIASIFPLAEGSNTYTIKVVPYTASGETVSVKIELLAGSGGPVGFPGFGQPDPTVAGNPRYQTLFPPKGSGAESGDGEMNIGFNPATGRFMLNNIGPVWRVTPPEVASPGTPECCNALWEDRSSRIADAGVDPILWTDQKTGRTFVSNFTASPNALYGYSDNDGDVWVPVGASLPSGGADHQTIGSGLYPASLGALVTPVNRGEAVYFCSQAVAGPAFCQRSDDLGASYGPGTLAYSGQECGGLHGHIRVGPDGAAYLPVPDCNGKAGLSVSIDGGVTWQEFYLPNSLPQSAGSDSAIAIDANNKLYYFYIVSSPDATKGTMHVQVGERVFNATGQLTNIIWSRDTDLGASHGILNSAFPHAVAGDSGRAAVGFLGTDRAGDFQSLSFPGYWYAFMSTTFDGGNTWVTTNTSPNDPVQGKGGIWQMGGSATNRNLLDFNEITIDDKGRPAFAYSDGCVGDCVGNPDVNSFTAHMRLARQSGGRTLFASQDGLTDNPGAPILPKAPCLSGTRDPGGSRLKWIAPNNGGSDILYYKVFRGTEAGSETFLADTGSAALPNARTSFDDITADPNVEHYFYKVQAVTAVGSGALSNAIDLVVVPLPPVATPCTLPGITVLTDRSGDSAAGQQGLPQHDIQSVSVAEPFFPDGSQKLVFTIKVANLAVLPSSTIYPLFFKTADGNGYYVALRTSAPASVAAPRFEYGTATISGAVYTTTYVGNADPASNYQTDGTIRIVVPRSRFGTPTVGTVLNEFFLRVRVGEATTVTPDNCPDSLVPAGSYTIAGNAACAPTVTLLEAVSRKTHGTAGDFDLRLPLTGNSAIEPRSGGANGDHKVIFTFGDAVSQVGSVSAMGSQGGIAATGAAGPGPSQYTVNLSGVANAQRVTITLNNVQSGPATAATLQVNMGVLAGDTTSNGSVNSSDISETKSQSGIEVSPANFRLDVTVNGAVNSSDISLVKSRSGTALDATNSISSPEQRKH
jgi:hypothetical protein